MTVKSKLVLGIGTLFILIVGLAAVSMQYINELTGDTKNILAANYNTLEYSRNMLLTLDETGTQAVIVFEENLSKQLGNVTEPGEKELTGNLVMHFENYKRQPENAHTKATIRKDIYALMALNMQAIQRKSDIAGNTAEEAGTWIVITGTLCFLIAFSLLLSFPGAVANPIKNLTQSIQEIANKNYKERLHFKSRDEFETLAEAFNTMAAKLEEYDNSNLAKLLMEKKRIETLINKLHHPVMGLDEKLNILFVNGEALAVLGLKTEQVLNQPALRIAASNDLMRLLLQDIILEEEAHVPNNNVLKIYADGKESYFEKEVIPIVVTPTGEKLSKAIGHVIILQNITPFKELDSAKTNFIATISHELKTPISAIKMGLQLLEDERIGKVNEEQGRLISGIKDDSERLLKITGELLNLSQVETGNIQLSMQQSDPGKIVDYAREAVKMQAEQKQISIHYDIGDNITHVKADIEKTAWVLINLLTNAIRYSNENGSIHIGVKALGNEVEFSVKDSGRGIDSRYTAKIFDRYFQVPGSNRSGTGLGLAISKEFIEAQEGSIGVESNLGEGSRFYFRLKQAK